jgi:hypothetical protein
MSPKDQWRAKPLKEKTQPLLAPKRLPDCYRPNSVRTQYGNLHAYLHLVNLDEPLREGELNHWNYYGRQETLYVTLEGTLISNDHKRLLVASKQKFSWEDYYASIQFERINVRHLPIIRAAREISYSITLVCSTPAQYERFVVAKLRTHRLYDLFNTVMFKPRPEMNTKQWTDNVWSKRRRGRFSNGWLLSDTYKPPLADNERAFYF